MDPEKTGTKKKKKKQAKHAGDAVQADSVEPTGPGGPTAGAGPADASDRPDPSDQPSPADRRPRPRHAAPEPRPRRPESDRRARRATRGGDRSPTFGAGRRAVVLVVSTSAAAGTAEDSAGPLLVGWLSERGYAVDGTHVVPDGAAVGKALHHHLRATPEDQRPRILVTTGGTGLAPDDRTPEETRRFLDKEARGIAQALVDYGLEKLPEAAMSRGTAGSADRTFVVNLPGSVGGVKDGMAVLDPLLHHIQAQLEDGLDGARASDDGVHPPRARVDGGAGAEAPPGSADPLTRTVVMASEGLESFSAGASTVVEEDISTVDTGSTEIVDTEIVDTDTHDALLDTQAFPVFVGRITEEPLDADAAQARVLTSSAGAVALFRGVVRDHDGGRDDVVGLEYSAHPDAPAVLAQVLEEAHADFPGVLLWAEHRIGRLAVGDDALVAVAASAHRGEAFAACAELVDRVKARVPIWKRQDYADGAHDWVGIE